MKKIKLVFTTVALLFTTVLVSCSMTVEKLDPKNPVILKFGAYYADSQLSELSKLVDKFNEKEGRESGIIVELITMPSGKGIEQYLTETANNESNTGDFPDIFITYKSIVPYLKDKVKLINFKDYLTDNEISEYIDRLVEEGYLTDDKNVLTMMPVGSSTEIMFFNKTDFDKFAKATGAKLESGDTLENILKTAELYYDYTDAKTPDIKQDGKALIGFDAAVNHMLSSLKSMGIDILSKRGDKYVLNFPRKAARKVWELYIVPTLKGYMAKYAKYTSVDLQSGSILLAVSSTAASAYISGFVADKDTGDKREVDITTMLSPTIDGGMPVSSQQGGGVFIASTTPLRISASIAFFKWLTNKENNTEFSLKCSYMPVRKDNSSEAYIKEKAAEFNVDKKIRDSIITSLTQTKDRSIYVRPYFENYERVRMALTRILDIDIQKKRAELLSDFNGGKGTYESLLEKALSEKSFQSWYKDTFKTLQDEIN